MGYDPLPVLVSPTVLSLSRLLLTIYFSYGLSLVDGNDSMVETEQISKQIFTREAKVYDRWYQLYPALLHLYATARRVLSPSALLTISLTAIANPTTISLGKTQ